MIDPGIDLGGREPERHVAKVRERGGTAGPRDFRGVVHVGKPRRNRVEGFERPDQLTGCEYLDGEPAAGKRPDGCRDTFGARLQAGQGLGPDGDHLELVHALGDGGLRS